MSSNTLATRKNIITSTSTVLLVFLAVVLFLRRRGV